MRTLSFNTVDGLIVTNDSLIIVTDLNALVQKLNERLRFFLGEWLLDITQGVPYFQQIFEKPVDAGLIVNILAAEMRKEPDVNEIQNLTIEFDRVNRQFTYSCTVVTIFGSSDTINSVSI